MMLMIAAAAILSGSAAMASAQLAHPPGLGERAGESSIAVGINAAGQVAGIIEEENGAPARGAGDRHLIELGTLGGSEGFTRGINAGGDVVAPRRTAPATGAPSSAAPAWRWRRPRHPGRRQQLRHRHQRRRPGGRFRRHRRRLLPPPSATDATAPLVDLGTLGGNISYAAGINNHGDIVGTAALRDGYRRAFVYRPGAGMTNLGTLGGRSSSATAISDNGIVVGASETATAAGTPSCTAAARWSTWAR